MEDYNKLLNKIKNIDLPYPTPMVYSKQTPHEKKMAKYMQKLIDYEYAQIKASKMLRTPWGVLMWTPKNKIIKLKKERV